MNFAVGISLSLIRFLYFLSNSLYFILLTIERFRQTSQKCSIIWPTIFCWAMQYWQPKILIVFYGLPHESTPSAIIFFSKFFVSHHNTTEDKNLCSTKRNLRHRLFHKHICVCICSIMYRIPFYLFRPRATRRRGWKNLSKDFLYSSAPRICFRISWKNYCMPYLFSFAINSLTW